MGELSCFLAQNALKSENVMYVASNRFLNGKKPIEWEIKALTSDEDEAIRRSCMKKVQVPGKRGQYTQDTDYDQYLGKLAAACTVFPNLNDKELQDSYGVMGSDTVLKKMLLPGEYAEYLRKVQEVNGFDATTEELVEEVKN